MSRESRETRDLALDALYQPIDTTQSNQCLDCVKASIFIRKAVMKVTELDEDGKQVKDKIGNLEKVDEEFLVMDIHCEQFRVLMTEEAYHCSKFEPLEGE